MPGEPMKWPTKVWAPAFEQLDRRTDLHHLALLHHHDLIGEGQRLGLVMGDIDHGHPTF